MKAKIKIIEPTDEILDAVIENNIGKIKMRDKYRYGAITLWALVFATVLTAVMSVLNALGYPGIIAGFKAAELQIVVVLELLLLWFVYKRSKSAFDEVRELEHSLNKIGADKLRTCGKYDEVLNFMNILFAGNVYNCFLSQGRITYMYSLYGNAGVGTCRCFYTKDVKKDDNGVYACELNMSSGLSIPISYMGKSYVTRIKLKEVNGCGETDRWEK